MRRSQNKLKKFPHKLKASPSPPLSNFFETKFLLFVVFIQTQKKFHFYSHENVTAEKLTKDFFIKNNKNAKQAEMSKMLLKPKMKLTKRFLKNIYFYPETPPNYV